MSSIAARPAETPVRLSGRERFQPLMLAHDVMLAGMVAKEKPCPDSPEIRNRRYALYQSAAASGRFDVGDAHRPIAAVQADIFARFGGKKKPR